MTVGEQQELLVRIGLTPRMEPRLNGGIFIFASMTRIVFLRARIECSPNSQALHYIIAALQKLSKIYTSHEGNPPRMSL